WVGLENFRDLFRNEAFLLAMRNTLFQLIMAIFILYHIKNNK
ncbi:MAG TPA: polysaccharide ABC transporter ATP-binding protein, partial [Clostridiales bacterium]|nr:polysaccharide ABC transporter ATP-binding protein [Clostridiales bacterium]